MIAKQKDLIYSYLDTFFYSCPFKNDDSTYSYGCSHGDNETDGQCLACGCPLLWEHDYCIEDGETWIDRVFNIEYLSPEKSYCDPSYLVQADQWGDGLVCACSLDDFSIFNLKVEIDYETEIRTYISSSGIRGQI